MPERRQLLAQGLFVRGLEVGDHPVVILLQEGDGFGFVLTGVGDGPVLFPELFPEDGDLLVPPGQAGLRAGASRIQLRLRTGAGRLQFRRQP